MAYDKQSWVDNTTPVDAEHLNHMEEGIGANADDIAELNADLTDVKILNGYITGTGSSISFSADMAVVFASFNASLNGYIYVCRNTYVNIYEATNGASAASCESTSANNFTLNLTGGSAGSRLYYIILGINLSQTSTTSLNTLNTEDETAEDDETVEI